MKPHKSQSKPKKKAPEGGNRQGTPKKDALDSALQDTFPASDPISFIEPATKDDPTTERQPSNQEEPPRAPGP